MRKAVAYGAMAGFVLILAGADTLLLTSSAALSRLTARELTRISDGLLTWGEVRASLDGRVTLEHVALRTKGAKASWFQAARVELRLRGGLGGTLRRVALENVRIVLTEPLIEEFTRKEKEPKRSIREIFPNAEDLPRIVCRGGIVETRFPDYLAGERPQVSSLRDLTLTPLAGYRLHVGGRFANPVLGDWRAEGEVDLDGGAWRGTLRTAGWVVRPEVREALAQEEHRGIFDRFRPSGLCDLTVSMGQVPGEALDFRATLAARDMGLVYVNFPYPVERIKGEIDFLARGFRIKHAEGRHKGGAVVRIDGASDGYPRESELWLRIEIDDVPLDAELRAALQPDARRVWDLLEPKGVARVRGRALHEAGPGPERIPLDITLRDASFRYKDFPYEIRNLSGELSIEDQDVTIRRLAAREGGASVDLAGSIRDITGASDIDLTIDARGLPLDDRLKRALPEDARKVWDTFSPSGPIDVRWNVRQEKGKEAVHRARAWARGNAVLYREVPLPISEVEGEIELEPGRTRLHHVKGKVEGAAVEVHGAVTDEGMSLRLDAVGLPLSDAVKEALPKDVGGLLKQMRLGGTAHFKSDLKLRKGGEKRVKLDLRRAKGTIDTEPRFEDLHGVVTLIGFFEAEPTFMGSLNFSQATVAGKRLTDLSSSFNGKGSRINFSFLKATAYGGLVSCPGFSIDTKTGDFSGSFNVDRLDIREYALDTSGFAEKTLAGKASLELTGLAGRTGDAGTIKGQGRLKVREGLLWDIPLFVSLFTFNPQDLFKARNQFDAGNVDFEIAERKFLVSSLAFTSSTVSLAGSGRINFDGDMHLRLKVKSGPLFGIDFIITEWAGKILDFITGALVSLDVKGPFEKPAVSATPLPGFK